MSLTTLIDAFTHEPAGLCGAHEPAGAITTVRAETELRLRMLALGTILDVLPQPDRWMAIARAANHWLFDTSVVAYKQPSEVGASLAEVEIKAPRHNARVWWQVCRGVQGRFKGSFRDLLAANGDNALAVQTYLQASKTTFPVLSGPVISVRWLDLVHRIASVPLAGWEDLSVPLPSTLSDAARAFGAHLDVAHPMAAQVLAMWLRSCKQLTPPDCAVKDCPLRSVPRG